MKAGDTFRLVSGKIEGAHPHFVLCNPSQDDIIAIANLTDWKPDKDQSCVLEPGDDHIVAKRSVVSYRDATLVSNRELDAFLANGAIVADRPLSQATLDKVLSGFGVTRRAQLKVVDFLDGQGLIPIV